jgi:NitT/TauT family transport system substrate-binding protein
MVACNPNVVIAMQMVTQCDVPWSVYYRETATITPEILDAQKRFCIALQKGIDWVLLHDAESFQDELSELFPSIPIDVVISVTNDFRRNGMWTTTSLPRNGYDRWQLGLRDACLITEPIVYEDLIDNAPSAAAQIFVKDSS